MIINAIVKNGLHSSVNGAYYGLEVQFYANNNLSLGERKTNKGVQAWTKKKENKRKRKRRWLR
jgi:hypothetical protein